MYAIYNLNNDQRFSSQTLQLLQSYFIPSHRDIKTINDPITVYLLRRKILLRPNIILQSLHYYDD